MTEQNFTIEELNNETWKSVTDFEDTYRISNLGRLKNIKRNKIVATFNSRGYRYVKLFKNGHRHQRSIHRLVAKEFLPNFSISLEVHHKNNCRFDNRASNLQMVTGSENLAFVKQGYAKKKERRAAAFAADAIKVEESLLFFLLLRKSFRERGMHK